MSLSDYFGPSITKRIVRAAYRAHEANRISYDPLVGNTAMNFGIAAWQSFLFFLEQEFGSVVGAKVDWRGSKFCIHLETCTLYFYKFSSRLDARASSFRLDGSRSQTRKKIVENNQTSLFNFTMGLDAQPIAVPELVVIYSGNPRQGLLQVHIGAPISAKSYENGWLWPPEQVYEKNIAADETPFTTERPPIGPSFDEMPEPDVEVQGFDDLPQGPDYTVEQNNESDDDGREKPEADTL